MDTSMFFSIMICFILVHLLAIQCLGLTEEENLELDKELLTKNRPYVKTITTKFGNIYDCVDFYNQPAFDHPLLKNHTFHPEMTPTYKRRQQNYSSNGKSLRRIFKEVGCPKGSVPIRRTTKTDLIRRKEYLSKFRSFLDRDIKIKAVVQTIQFGGPFVGASTIAGIYRPSVPADEYSGFRISIMSGDASDDCIQIGWIVFPNFYGDDKVRLFFYHQAGTIGCFNTECPGFVVTNTQYPLDSVFEEYYTIGNPAVPEIYFNLVRDEQNGNWWAEIGDHIRFGFWPAEIFASLKQPANYVEWGGTVSSFPVPMGLGTVPVSGDTGKEAYARQITVLKLGGMVSDAVGFSANYSTTNNYKSIDVLHGYHNSGHAVLYGGIN